MNLYLSAGVSGVALGLAYGLVGFAIVMLYRATAVANFAQGTLGMLGAFVAFVATDNLGYPLYLSVLAALAASALLGVVVFFLVIRPREEAGNLNIIIRTLGLSMLVLAVAELQWGAKAPYRFPSVVEGNGVTIASVTIPAQAIATALVSLAIAGALWVLFNLTPLGLSLRSSRLSAMIWALSCVLGTVVAILLAPSSFLLPTMMEPYLMFTFTGIVLGGLTSMPGALVGCVIVGVVSNVATVAVSPEIGVVVIFVMLLLGMLLRPQGLFGKPESVRL